jgi:hypothetical protein
MMCKINKIRYIDANILGTIFNDAPSLKSTGHPTINEHYKFAEQLLQSQ